MVLEVAVSTQKEGINACAKMDMSCLLMVIAVSICGKNHATWKNHKINVKSLWQGKKLNNGSFQYQIYQTKKCNVILYLNFILKDHRRKLYAVVQWAKLGGSTVKLALVVVAQVIRQCVEVVHQES